jgi:O-antigen/teichoic acid export membrane protein
MLIMSALVVRGGLQTAGLLLAAWLLGPTGYGAVVGLSALTVLLAQIAAPGIGEVMLREIVRGQDGRTAVWRAQFILLLFGTLICLVLAAVQSCVPFAPGLGFVVLIGAADILAMRSLDMVQFHQQAVGSDRGVALIQVVTGLARPLAAGVLWVTGGGAEEYAIAYMSAASCAAVTGLVILVRQVGPPVVESTRGVWAMIRAGGPFVGTALARSAGDLDRFLLERLAGPAAAGVYGLATRGVDYACIPARAVLMRTFGSFFVVGESGPSEARAHAWLLLPKTALFGLVGSLFVLLGAFLLPWVLGPKWAEAGTCMLILAPLPILRAVQSLFGDAMSGSDRQTLRMLLMWLVAIVQLGLLAVMLDGAHGDWAKTAWMALLGGGCLMVLTVVCGREGSANGSRR